MNKDFSLFTEKGDKLSISCFGLENVDKSPCLILVHGFKGFKDWGFFPYASNYLANCGFFVITFNFSHCGIDDKNFDFFDLKKFAKNTVSLEVSELVQVINAYKNGFFGIAFGKIGLIGHSRGGGVAILSSLIIKVDAYVVWASVEKFDRYTERQKDEWKNKGYLEVLNSRTNQMLRMNVELLEDIELNKNGSLSIENAVKDLDKALLIIHGTEDLTVPVDEGEQIYNWSNKDLTEFIKLPACGHTFDIVHPFEGSNKKFDKVLFKSKEFLRKVFKQS